MIKEILKIVPQISMDDLKKMERTLTQRFGNIAKKFGRGLLNTMKGGGVVGGFSAIFAKLLNPLKETQDAIERTLTRADDLSTFAKQFGTTAGKLAKLEAFATASGLDREGLLQLLNKFQGSLAETNADPTKQGALSQFRGRTDTADAFFDFIQNLQKLDQTTQRRVQEEVFGEKQILKASEFLGQNFNDLGKKLEKFFGPGLDAGIEKLAELQNLNDLLKAQREIIDLQKKTGLIGEGDIRQINRSQVNELNRENQNIARFKTLSDVDNSLQEISQQISSLVAAAPGLIKGVETVVKYTVDGWTRLFNLLKEIPFLKRFLGG
jgi:hypothetical protein